MKRVAALILILILAFILCSGCANKQQSDYQTVDVFISSEGGVYVSVPPYSVTTAAPILPTEEPTPVPTAVPTAAPTPQPTEQEHKGGENGRRIFLTFDDGPNANTGKTLDILNRYGIKATFFTVGMCVEQNPAFTRRIVEEGHLLACHTYSHDLNSIYKSADAFLADIAKWRKVVTKAVGWDAGSYYLRFPGGTTNTALGGRSGRGPFVDAARAAGYHIYDWTIGTNDKWLAGNTDHLPITEYLWQSYRSTYDMYVNTNKPLIILIHDDVDECLEILPRIIDDLISRGCSFGTVNELGDFLM